MELLFDKIKERIHMGLLSTAIKFRQNTSGIELILPEHEPILLNTEDKPILQTYLANATCGHVANDVYRTITVQSNDEAILNYLLYNRNFYHDSNIMKVLCMWRDHALPDAVSNILPSLKDQLNNNESIMAHIWPVAQIISTIPVIKGLSPADEARYCPDHPEVLSMHHTAGTRDAIYTGWSSRADRIVTFYIHDTDATKPWTLESRTDQVETIKPVTLYRPSLPEIKFYEETIF